MTVPDTSTAPAEPTANGSTPPDSAPTVPTRARKRKGLIGLAAALITLGVLSFLYAQGQMSETASVIAVTTDLERGSVITEPDVTVAQMVTDPALSPIPGGRISDVIGLRTSTDLVAGSLLTEASLTAEVVPPQGQRLVGLSLSSDQRPGEPLRPGDIVLIVDTPGAGQDPPESTPAAITATVLAVHDIDGDQVVLDVLTDQDQALSLAARAATGRIGVVLDTRER